MEVHPRPQGRPHVKCFTRGTYEDLGDTALSAAEDERARRQIAQAERELGDLRVNLRWGRKQLHVIRKAAALAGLPYQSYLKEAAMRSAIADLRAAREAGIS